MLSSDNNNKLMEIKQTSQHTRTLKRIKETNPAEFLGKRQMKVC